ncbi:MAG: response regulator [Deltaproteobacteria bacterium]|nr:response regulator [Deltaproteobacteria bacterium]
MTDNSHMINGDPVKDLFSSRPILQILERAFPFAVVLVIAAGWYVSVQYKNTLEKAVISSYQETQLEIVRAVARSANYVADDLSREGKSLQEIEQAIFKRLVEPVRLLKNGDAWIYAPDHVVFDLSSDFPDEYRGKSMAQIFSIQVEKGASHYEAMTEDVMMAREGVGWYIWLPDKGKEIAAWTPVRLGPHTWSIGMSTPLPEILQATNAAQQIRFLFILMTVATILGVALALTALWSSARNRRLDLQLHSRNKELQGLVQSLQREIERRKIAEEEQRHLSERLHQAQKMEAIGLLAGGVAHDLNNTLSGIVSYPDLLLTQIPEESLLRKPLLTIKKSGEQAAGVVQDLLMLSRRGMGVMETVNLNEVVTEYLNSPLHKNLKLEHPKVEEDIRLEPCLPNMMGSAVHLSKTVMNLAINAYEAMPSGGTFAIRTETSSITASTKTDDIPEGEYVKLIVSDTGNGIAAEDLPRIFDPFFTKKVLGRSGSGLGLSVVWGMVQDHRGYIRVQSNQEKNTTFELYFPAGDRGKIMQAGSLPKSFYSGQGESILIVDDVELQRETTSAMLKNLGYNVAAVASGEEALEYLREHPVDLIILDMILGKGMDGLDTYREAIKIRPGQKAIIASGFSETDRVKKVQKLGAGSYVSKPYLMEKIGIAIRTELDRKPQDPIAVNPSQHTSS